MGIFRGLAAALVLAACPATFASDAAPSLPVVHIKGEDGVGGEINLIRSDGTVLRRLTGLGRPIWLSATLNGGYLLVDRSGQHRAGLVIIEKGIASRSTRGAGGEGDDD